jgi:hypothetical protein
VTNRVAENANDQGVEIDIFATHLYYFGLPFSVLG